MQVNYRMPVLKYFAQLKPPKLVLWCYLAWYIAIVICYFDRSPSLWLSSLGIAGIIGFALNLATQQQGQEADRWVVFRLYVFPFCVSSYSALIKGKGFFFLFPTELASLGCGIMACLFILAFHRASKMISGRST